MHVCEQQIYNVLFSIEEKKVKSRLDMFIIQPKYKSHTFISKHIVINLSHA